MIAQPFDTLRGGATIFSEDIDLCQRLTLAELEHMEAHAFEGWMAARAAYRDNPSREAYWAEIEAMNNHARAFNRLVVMRGAELVIVRV